MKITQAVVAGIAFAFAHCNTDFTVSSAEACSVCRVASICAVGVVSQSYGLYACPLCAAMDTMQTHLSKSLLRQLSCTCGCLTVFIQSGRGCNQSGLACRCYEIRCSTGTVIGNYSADNSDAVIPYNITGGFIPKVNLDTVVDDYGRHWNGNDLMSEDELFTQCYNASQVSIYHGIFAILA